MTDQNYKLAIGQVIGGRFQLIEKLGQGSFGSVYKTQNLKNGDLYAMKFEKRHHQGHNSNLLYREIKVLSLMKEFNGFPSLIYYGKDEKYNFFMSTLLGSNLETLCQKCGGFFNQDTINYIARSTIDRIKELHSKGIIHRDLKPENLVIGNKDHENINLIDFGLAKYYQDADGKHIALVKNKGLIGTARYASISSLKGNEQGRKDDLESLGYTLIYLSKGKLPWINLQIVDKKEKYNKIQKMKEEISVEELCSSLPHYIIQYLNIVRQMQFDDFPKYAELKDLFPINKQSPQWINLEEFNQQEEVSIDVEVPQIPQMEDDIGTIALSMKKINSYEQSRKFIQKKSKAYMKNVSLIKSSGNDLQTIRSPLAPQRSNDIDSSQQNHCSISMNKHVSFNSAAFMHSKLVNDSRIVSKNEFSLVLNINDDDEQEIQISDDDGPNLEAKTPKKIVLKCFQIQKQ